MDCKHEVNDSDLYKLSNQEIGTFLKDGVIVIENALSKEEVSEVRKEFHDYLHKNGVNIKALGKTAPNLNKLSSTNGAGGILDIYYEAFELFCQTHPKLFNIVQQLWKVTWATNKGHYTHPFKTNDFCDGFCAFDRCCFRIPDKISQIYRTKSKRFGIQRSLVPHLDSCGYDQFGFYEKFKNGKGVKGYIHNKWKPIQCFLSLTDNLKPNTGGFECYPGFHTQSQNYFEKKIKEEHKDEVFIGCETEFVRFTRSDPEVFKGISHIKVKAGSLVCWDTRLPHANSWKQLGETPREVIYCSFLPNVDINRSFMKHQMELYTSNHYPMDQWHTRKDEQVQIESKPIQRKKKLESLLSKQRLRYLNCERKG